MNVLLEIGKKHGEDAELFAEEGRGVTGEAVGARSGPCLRDASKLQQAPPLFQPSRSAKSRLLEPSASSRFSPRQSDQETHEHKAVSTPGRLIQWIEAARNERTAERGLLG